MVNSNITRCVARACPMRNSCVRYAPPVTYSLVWGISFFPEDPVKPDGTCDYYLEDENASARNGRKEVR